MLLLRSRSRKTSRLRHKPAKKGVLKKSVRWVFRRTFKFVGKVAKYVLVFVFALVVTIVAIAQQKK